ncbi:hypothetical protein IPU62_25430, partial [Pseudogracilibacillus auburnensis]|nr:hypothetical protein [Pseudogracilibacillus auburnensis]
MTQDVNKIIDNLNGDWASDMLGIKKRVAILLEENERLKEENKQLKEDEQAK